MRSGGEESEEVTSKEVEDARSVETENDSRLDGIQEEETLREIRDKVVKALDWCRERSTEFLGCLLNDIRLALVLNVMEKKLAAEKD
ncbi:unnamed protein product [Gongylonema pulchrum]|uniref:Uncharacterized protein n=1 Tax=Gongylonema pulchrum TaxID=637853 RepID=A0A183DDJ1_9BILA|nr:unnamed protein product [Gongylonema pulchrum]